jgi:hypothetical protein
VRENFICEILERCFEKCIKITWLSFRTQKPHSIFFPLNYFHSLLIYFFLSHFKRWHFTFFPAASILDKQQAHNFCWGYPSLEWRRLDHVYVGGWRIEKYIAEVAISSINIYLFIFLFGCLFDYVRSENISLIMFESLRRIFREFPTRKFNVEHEIWNFQ